MTQSSRVEGARRNGEVFPTEFPHATEPQAREALA